MAREKEGKLVKLDYDFNTVKCCEVEYKPGKWARATVREFRSFNTPGLSYKNGIDPRVKYTKRSNW